MPFKFCKLRENLYREVYFSHTCLNKLHLQVLCDLYSSPNIIRVIKERRMRCPGHVAGMGVGRGAYKVLVRKPEGRRPRERSRHTWENNIKIDLPEEGG
jgi:hypothetical protein